MAKANANVQKEGKMMTPMQAQAKMMKDQVDRMKNALAAPSVQEQFRLALRNSAGPFMTSILELFGSDENLNRCSPKDVIMEAMKAASLGLSINKQVGHAYIVPYGNKPTFILGYRGYIQLALRTKEYKYINAGVIYEGVKVNQNFLTGEVSFEGQPKSTKAVGYFAYIEMLTGFSKAEIMTREEAEEHGKKYSKAYNSGPWKTNFDEMAIKTVLRRLISRYGVISRELETAMGTEVEDELAREIAENANVETIDIDVTPEPESEPLQDAQPLEEEPPQEEASPEADTEAELQPTGTESRVPF